MTILYQLLKDFNNAGNIAIYVGALLIMIMVMVLETDLIGIGLNMYLFTVVTMCLVSRSPNTGATGPLTPDNWAVIICDRFN